MELGKIDAAIEHLERAVALRPESANAHRRLAAAYIARHEDGLAAPHLRRVLESQPDYVIALKDLGLLLAVTSDDAVRNGTEAVELAQRAVTLTSRRDPASLAALAAAFAELDRFDEAVAVVREAIALAPPESALAIQLSQLRDAYAAQRTVRRPSR